MARKAVKKVVSKGERLGWTPLNKFKSVTLSSIVVKGRRVSTVRRQNLVSEPKQYLSSFLIP
jgi:hypothetical protein